MRNSVLAIHSSHISGTVWSMRLCIWYRYDVREHGFFCPFDFVYMCIYLKFPQNTITIECRWCAREIWEGERASGEKLKRERKTAIRRTVSHMYIELYTSVYIYIYIYIDIYVPDRWWRHTIVRIAYFLVNIQLYTEQWIHEPPPSLHALLSFIRAVARIRTTTTTT